MPSRPLRVAIYARVSTSEQIPEAQLLALREYAACGASGGMSGQRQERWPGAMGR